MQKFKQDYDAIQEKKKQLAEQKVGDVRKALVAAMGDERRALKVLDERTGESFHVRLDERDVKCAPSLSLIAQALVAMEEPTAEDFLRRLGGVCTKTSRTLKMTKNTRTESVDPSSAELKALCLGLRQVKTARDVIRKDLKAMREAFAASEATMAAALAGAGKAEEQGTDAEGMPFLVCRKTTRARKRVPTGDVPAKVAAAFDVIRSAGRAMTTEEMAAIIYDAINPVCEGSCIVIR